MKDIELSGGTKLKSILSPEVMAMFPGYTRGVVIGKGINNSEENQGLSGLLRQAEQETVLDTTLEDIRSHPKIASWRNAYTNFGVNPNKFVSSIESLCRRVKKGDQLPYINTAVALFNYFSLSHVVPSGGDDLDNVHDDLRLVRASGNESFTPFNSDIIEYPLPGEIIYVTNSIVMCRRWNWRQGNQTKLTPATRNIAVNVDCLPPISKEEAASITAELADLMRKFCGGEIKYFMLSTEQNEGEI